MSTGWYWVTIVLALLAGIPAANADDAPADPVLYLTPRSAGALLPNFTAAAPTMDDAVRVTPAPILTGSGEVVWKWVMMRVPERWAVPAGTELSAELHFLRLDRIVPVPDPLEHPDGLGRIKVQVDFLRLSSDAPVASGSTTVLIDPVSAYSHPVDVQVTATTDQDAVYDVVPGDAPLFGIKVTLTGQARNQDPPLLLVGSRDAPSHVRLPTFPIDAFRDWERRDDAARACNERTLQGLPCEAIDADPLPHDAGPAPQAVVADPPAWSVRLASSDGLAMIGVGLWIILAGVTRQVLGHLR